MKLKVLSTGSIGNCYLLESETETLILDCGISFKDIKIGLDFDFSRVVGVLVTHSHSDHVKSAADFKKFGVDVWQPYMNEQKIQRRYFGGFEVNSFDVPHDDCPCVGYLIKCPDGSKLIYATDFEYIKYSFKKLRIQHALIECNYQQEYVNTEAINKSHIWRGHAELQTTKQIVQDNAYSLKNVILCHLSQGNANPYECIEEIQKVVNGANIDYARAGLDVELISEENEVNQ